jgi:MFS family permease
VIAQNLSYRWIFWIISMLAATTTILGVFFFPETFGQVLLLRRAKKLRKESGLGYHTRFEKSAPTLEEKLSVSMTRPFRLLLKHPLVQALSLVQGYNFGINYIMLSTFAEMWINNYGQTVSQSGYNYVSVAIGNTLAAQVGGRCMDIIYARLKTKSGGERRPEYRIPLMIPGCLMIPIGCLWYGWAAESRSYWLLTDFGCVVFACGLIVNGQATTSYLVDSYADYTASASAAATLARSIASFVFPIFAPQMYSTLGYGWGNSVLTIISCAIGLPAPLLLWKYGASLRAMGGVLE